MKVVLPHRANSSLSNARTCSADDCVKVTREGKPYCPDHVELNTYSQRVIANIKRRAEEDEKVRLGKAGPGDDNTRGITAQEILQTLEDHGPRTIRRLCREINIDTIVMDGYIKVLIADGLVSTGKTIRGNVVISLLEKKKKKKKR